MSGGLPLDGAAQHRGSELLLRKLPLLAKAHALAQQNPADPQAECNVLCYGPDVYRIHALAHNTHDRDGLLLLQRQALRRHGDRLARDENEDEEFEASMENKVSLPTRMSFLTTVEAGLRKSSASLREADRKRRAEEKRAAKGKGTEGSAPVGSAGVKNSDNRDDSEEDAVARGSAGAGENGIDSRRGGEERVILRAAREALEKPRELGVDVTGRDDAAGLERSNNNIKGRIPWERMLEFLMSHDGVDSDGNGEAIRSYLRRISWIEQQKKLQPVHSGAVEALQHGVQSWLSMPEAMRVQREMQRMRAQRKRFRRPQKEKSSG